MNRQAEIIAGGDVIVWGRLRGSATAGKSGERSSVIVALELDPTDLRIADRFA